MLFAERPSEDQRAVGEPRCFVSGLQPFENAIDKFAFTKRAVMETVSVSRYLMASAKETATAAATAGGKGRGKETFSQRASRKQLELEQEQDAATSESATSWGRDPSARFHAVGVVHKKTKRDLLAIAARATGGDKQGTARMPLVLPHHLLAPNHVLSPPIMVHRVPVGAYIVMYNTMDVTKTPAKEVAHMLLGASHQHRRLTLLFKRPSPLTIIQRTMKGRHPQLQVLRSQIRSPWLTEQHKYADGFGTARTKELLDEGEQHSVALAAGKRVAVGAAHRYRYRYRYRWC